MVAKMTQETFLTRAHEKHGDFYDYSKSVYESFRKNVTITCPVHGDFQQLPSNHLKGTTCKQCFIERNKLNIDQFIERSQAVHGDKYDYSGVVINGADKKVLIGCPDHGQFEQWVMDHLRGSGCPRCGWEKERNRVQPDNTGRPCSFKGKPRIDRESFITIANEKHDDYYDYSSLEMVPMNSKGVITCPIHGEFSQRLADHINGVGCPTCGKSKQGQYSEEYFLNNPEMKDMPGYIYLVQVNSKHCKIGITKNSVGRRFRNKNIKPIHVIKTTLYEAWCMEQRLLSEYKYHRYQAPELQKVKRFTGWTECFPIDLKDILKESMQTLQ